MLLSFIWLHERIEESMEASGALKNKKPFFETRKKAEYLFKEPVQCSEAVFNMT